MPCSGGSPYKTGCKLEGAGRKNAEKENEEEEEEKEEKGGYSLT